MSLSVFAASLHGALKTCDDIDASNGVIPGSDNSRVLGALHQRLSKLYPAAGSSYWSLRCWAALSWQPLFLGLAAVHGVGSLPDFRSLRLRVQERSIYGYAFQNPSMEKCDAAQAIPLLGPILLELLDELLLDLQKVTSLHRSIARASLADSLLEGLVRLLGLLPSLEYNMEALAALWLDSLKLSGSSVLKLSDEWTVKRQSCCLHVRVDPNDRCTNCPALRRRIKAMPYANINVGPSRA